MVIWAGSETVSVEEYCTLLREIVGVELVFECTADAHTPLWPDVTRMHEVLGAGRRGHHDAVRVDGLPPFHPVTPHEWDRHVP